MRFALLIIIFILPSVACLAQSPVPPTHPVNDLQHELKTRESREKELKAELKKIKSGVSQKRKEMIAVAAKIKKNEKDLLKLESNIEVKQKERDEIEGRLQEDRGAISDLILAMERMRRIPPEALIARPGAPLETAQSAMLLENILPRINKRAENLKQDAQHLSKILNDLQENRNIVLETSKDLEQSHKKLSVLLAQREGLYAKTSKNVKKEQAELKRISAQAKNLKDLVSRIEQKQRQEDQRRQEKIKAQELRSASLSSPRIVPPARTPIPKSGQSQLPISGIISIGYGKPDNIGAVSEGLKITGRDNALVVAPMGGVVDYAGFFKGYGQIIILKHEKGYHSLIAGLNKIDTVVGRGVSAGEPIGKMGRTTDNEPPMLYYELRYKGNPVNPSKKIAGL